MQASLSGMSAYFVFPFSEVIWVKGVLCMYDKAYSSVGELRRCASSRLFPAVSVPLSLAVSVYLCASAAVCHASHSLSAPASFL